MTDCHRPVLAKALRQVFLFDNHLFAVLDQAEATNQARLQSPSPLRTDNRAGQRGPHAGPLKKEDAPSPSKHAELDLQHHPLGYARETLPARRGANGEHSAALNRAELLRTAPTCSQWEPLMR
jgi:hypothetical protein